MRATKKLPGQNTFEEKMIPVSRERLRNRDREQEQRYNFDLAHEQILFKTLQKSIDHFLSALSNVGIQVIDCSYLNCSYFLWIFVLFRKNIHTLIQNL